MSNMNIPQDAIAITGMACRFPGAANVEEFWRNLRDGVESVTFFTDAELLAAGANAELLRNPSYVKANGIIPDIDKFDAGFFGHTPAEAEMMDPQQRVFLETAWSALEDAGIDPGAYKKLIGIFAGSGMNSYIVDMLSMNRSTADPSSVYQALISNDKDFLATRVSFSFNLRGPSFNVQSACSTSLVATHLACQSLLSGECDLALAGGCTIRVPQTEGYLYQSGMILSPDGHCRAFDKKAQGVVGGSGAGVVALKRLEDAIADGDNIYAVIRGSAINNDGARKVGYTAPGVDGQAEVIAEALAVAGVSADTVTCVEAHGTGTPLGDPIEIAALTQAFRHDTARSGYCAIGSVKTNIGHTDTAAGVAGVIKTALALRHGMIPPSLHFSSPNPQIDFANSPFFVNAKPRQWTCDGPRRAGVSSFGIGGTNAHIVLEQAPQQQPSGQTRCHSLLPLSAKSQSALDTMVANLSDHLSANPSINIGDVAYTLSVGRRAMERRAAVICESASDGAAALREGRVISGAATSRRRVGFMFSGQGSQHTGMGRDLYECEASYRAGFDECADILKNLLGIDLRDIVFSDENSRDINRTKFTQPALFAVEYALAKTLMSWGVAPAAMIGHSVGEYVAACIAGVFSLTDALKIVAVRGAMMDNLPAGSMLSVALSEGAARGYLRDDLEIAAINAPGGCVISGETAAIDSLSAELTAAGVENRKLRVSHAFHSAMMEPIIKPFETTLRGMKLNTPSIPFVSNVTGTWITAAEATDPAYWSRHLRRAVRFADGVAELAKDPSMILLEVGPSTTLTSLASRCVPAETACVSTMRHPAETVADTNRLATALGKLWVSGFDIEWDEYYSGERRRKVSLPAYHFERKRYWIDAPKDGRITGSNKKKDISDWFHVPSWKRIPAPIAENITGSCLIFADGEGVGARLGAKLIERGLTVTLVHAGAAYEKISDTEYVIDPEAEPDYKKLITAIGQPPKLIAHCWNVTTDGATLTAESIRAGMNRAFYSMIYLTRALGDDTDARILIVTTDAHDVTGDENIRVENSLTTGPLRVIGLEYPRIACRAVDITTADITTDTTTQRLVTELLSATPSSSIAYRGHHRWTQTYEPIHIPSGAPTRLRTGGTYLITGGLGGIGLTLAEHLATRYKAKLILTGRGEVTDKLNQIENAENNIVYYRADTVNSDEMGEAIASGEKLFGEINGVIHCAGVTGEESFRLLADARKENCDNQFAPKIYGLMVLDKVFADKKPDFIMLMSSLATALGGLGFTAYASANSFMDSFAAWRNLTGDKRYITVNWDAWKSLAKTARSFGEKIDALAITPDEGKEVFERVATSRENQIFVSTADLQSRFASLAVQKITRMKDDAPVSDKHTRPPLAVGYVAPRDPLEETITRLWERVLGIEGIGVYDNYFELGGNSLMISQINSRLKEELRMEIPMAVYFEDATIDGMATRIRSLCDAPDREELTL